MDKETHKKKISGKKKKGQEREIERSKEEREGKQYNGDVGAPG